MNQESEPQNTKEILWRISEGLGFVETEPMKELRRELESGGLPETSFMEVLTNYHDLADSQIQNADDQAKVEIGLSISKAAIYLKTGRIENTKKELGMAREYAFNMYFDEIVKDIDSFLEKYPPEEARKNIHEILNRAEALLRGEYIDFWEAEGQEFEGPILDLNDESLIPSEIELAKDWIEKQLGFKIDKAPIKARYESPDGETKVLIFDRPVGPEDDRWFLSQWQNIGEKPSFILWQERCYEEQLELGYSEIKD